jgi:hypothetical protein
MCSGYIPKKVTMFDQEHYVPILKGREGEFGALRTLDDAAKIGMTPLVEVAPIPWDFENNLPAKTIDKHLEKIADRLDRA